MLTESYAPIMLARLIPEPSVGKLMATNRASLM
jgi:hypothetical protein